MPFQINTVTVAGAGTAQAFDGTNKAPWRNVTVRARPVNVGLVYIGKSTVNSTAGIALQPGESYSFNTDRGGGIRLDQLYADAANANDRVDYWAYND